jgi:hypothetical protein
MSTVVIFNPWLANTNHITPSIHIDKGAALISSCLDSRMVNLSFVTLPPIFRWVKRRVSASMDGVVAIDEKKMAAGSLLCLHFTDPLVSG